MPRAEEMFYPLAMSSPIGVFISQEKRFRFVNPGFERATGYSKDELLHLDPMSLVLPEDREHVRVSAVKMLKGASSQPYQYRIRHKSGVVRWILETVVSMEYEGRRAVCGYFMDTSERRQAEETLRQTEERLKFIAEKANDLIYRYRRTPRPGMEYVSPSALPITGFTPEEYYANPGILRDMVHPEDQARIEAFWASPAPSTQPIAIRFQHKAGQWRWLEINRTPVLDAAGNLQAIEGIARDVTERKQAEEALSRQAEVLRNVRDGVIVATLAGEVTFWNSGATAIFGYSSQDAMGMAMVNLYPDQAPQNFQATLKDIAAGTDLSAEWRGWRKDRSTVWVNLKISVMRDEPGRPIGILAIVNDVSDKMAAREREREQNALMEAVLSSTPSALVVLNDRLEVVLANKSFLHDFPAARGMALGRPIADLLPMPPLLDAAKRVLDAGESAIGLELVHDGAGGQRTFEVNILPMSADMRAGQKINARVLISMIDATESRAAQERLYHAGRLASVGEMAAGVAHELNTPLTSVLGYAELLESVDLTD
ncbi:MAG: PAS domain S-box protein [Chloroflexi bacterium]|nr:PAS domain S-box protein [Chloroflexota bacterium]